MGDGVSFLDTLLGRKHQAMIGLDISSSGVKLVELSQAGSGEFILDRFASESFEKGWIADGQIEKFDEVADAVRKVVAKSGTRTKLVAMAMPQSAVITKRIMLPAGLREEEMEMQVEAEANQYIPFSLDEVSLDFCVVGPSPTSAGDVEVLIAASRKDRVQDRQALAEAAGLKPAVLDIESYASRLAMQRIVSALPGEGKDALIALFEIGAENTSLKVLRDDELLYDRDQAFGGSQLTQLISRQYGFSFEEAEAKKLSGDLPEDYQSSILGPFVDSLSQEIGRALQYFFTSTPHHKGINFQMDRSKQKCRQIDKMALSRWKPSRSTFQEMFPIKAQHQNCQQLKQAKTNALAQIQNFQNLTTNATGLQYHRCRLKAQLILHHQTFLH